MRYFRLFDTFNPEGDLYRYNGQLLEMRGREQAWLPVIEFVLFAFPTPEAYFDLYLEGASKFNNDPNARYEEVTAQYAG